jgi:drug/metabolite transporter (DMT)-like permease
LYTTAAIFALCAAFMLALRDTFGRLAVRGIDPILGSFVTAIVGLTVLAAISAILGDFRTPLPPWGRPTLYIAIAGILRVTVARTLILAATQHIGSARTSATAATNAFFAAAFGILLLGETMSLFMGVGAALIVGESILIVRSQTGPASTSVPGSHIKGLVLALASAVFLGVSAVLSRLAIPAFASPNQANLFATAAGVLAFAPSLWGKPLRPQIAAWSIQTWGLLILTGTVASLGVTFVYMALSRAPVIFSFTIVQSRPLFVIIIAWLFF